jgi:hypothetical protein
MDNLLIAITIAGLGLSVVYIRSEYLFGRKRKAYERQKAMIQRELHATRLKKSESDIGIARHREPACL